MKLLGGLSALVVFVASLMSQGAQVAAQTPKYNNQIQVSGIVLPAQHVVVDEQGIILEIQSNTKKEITPTVYLGKISKENIRPISTEIYRQYREIVPEGRSKVGILYRRNAGDAPFKPLDSMLRTNIDANEFPLTNMNEN